MKSRVIAATWVLPISSGPLNHGCVVVRDGEIDWVGRESDLPGEYADVPVERYGGVLTPGLVNAHTHLQYTGFAALGQSQYRSFEHWSEAFEVAYEDVGEGEYWRDCALTGATQIRASGTTSVAEIVTDEPARGALAAVGLGGIEYLEAIGLVEAAWENGGREQFLRWLAAPSATQVGISPHAPYSLDPDVIKDLTALALARGLRVHSHVAESSVEAEFYRNGHPAVLEIYGDLRDEFKLIHQQGAGMSTAEYADDIGLLNATTHIAHAIYLDRAGRDLLLRRQTQVVLCPRSNQIIGLDMPPVADYLREGHDISIGTDSLASSPSLDVLEDAAMLARVARHQGYTDDDLHERLLHALTRGGATAMGATDRGVLAPGARADLAVFAFDADPANVQRSFIDGAAGTCVASIIGGRTVHAAAHTHQPG